jgi:hypothetical protein
MGCFWAKAKAARRRMLNFVMVAIVAIRRGTARAGAGHQKETGRDAL